MENNEINLINNSGYPLQYKTKGSAGADLYNYSDHFTFKPFERKLIPTGIYIDHMSKDFEAQIRPRSGLAVKKGLTVLNTPGTIDSDYKEEIQVILVNLSNEEVEIEKGERIAQIVFNKIEHSSSIDVKEEERRGGFGSTGN